MLPHDRSAECVRLRGRCLNEVNARQQRAGALQATSESLILEGRPHVLQLYVTSIIPRARTGRDHQYSWELNLAAAIVIKTVPIKTNIISDVAILLNPRP